MPSVSVLMGDHGSGNNVMLKNALSFCAEHFPGRFLTIYSYKSQPTLYFEISNSFVFLFIEFWSDGTLSYQSRSKTDDRSLNSYKHNLDSYTVSGVSLDKPPYTLKKALAVLKN